MKFRDKLDRKYLKIVAYVVLAVGISYALILLMGQYQSIGKSLTWRDKLACSDS